MATKKRDIRYIDKDFGGFKDTLINFSKTYFPNTYNDFSETSTGMLFMEMSAYVGDVLSFYIDNQIQETFIQHARQTENLFSQAYALGYHPKVTTAASVEISIFQLLPAKLVGDVMIPDFDYVLKVPENTQVTSNVNPNIKFLVNDVVDFSTSSSLDPTEVSVYQIAGTQPTSFLLKKNRKAISATINTTSFTFTTPKKFDTRRINDGNIIGILDIVDNEGNTWYEVPNLAQENVFDSIKNTNANNPGFDTNEDVPYILKLKQVQRRFAARFINSGSLQIEFGAGSVKNNDEEIIPNPTNVGLGLPFDKTKLTTAFSPLNFVHTSTYGISPSDMTLNVRYLTGGGLRSNVEAGELSILDDTNIVFLNSNLSDSTLANTVFDSLATNNTLKADGGQDGDTVEEVRQNALGNFQNQSRTVTVNDYLIRTLSMPSNLGVIAKAFTTPVLVNDYNLGEIPAVLELYVLTYDINKKLRAPSLLLKKNLKTYLSEYRMINDSIKIKDAFIVNIGLEFDIVVLPNYNNNEVLTKCITSLEEYFEIDRWQINEPIILKDIYVLLDKVEGVQTIKSLKLTNKVGNSLGYSNIGYDLSGATIDDVVYPSIDPMIFEVKIPESDIKGRVSNL